MDQKIEVNDEVSLLGTQPGRFVVVGFEGSMAILTPFGDDKNTGKRVYLRNTEQAAIDNLVLRAKNHKRPAAYDEL